MIEGKCGECLWMIKMHTLIIMPGKGNLLADSNKWPWRKYRDKIRRVMVKPGVKAVTCENMFEMLTECTEMDLHHLDTSDVKSTRSMFGMCENLTMVLLYFNTRFVEDMSCMFEYCSSLKELNISGLRTGNVKNMAYMFCGCRSLEALHLSSFDTKNVTTMRSMFDGCSNLIELNLLHFDTSNVKDMSSMFNGCSRLTCLDLSSFDTGLVENMAFMFAHCSRLTNINLSNFSMFRIRNAEDMFHGCPCIDE